MTVSFFMGLEPAFENWAEPDQTAVERVNRFLVADGWPRYVEPAELPDVYEDGGRKFGRSSLSNHDTRSLRAVGQLLGSMGKPSFLGRLMPGLFGSGSAGTVTPLQMLEATPEFVAFVPDGKEDPVMTDLVNSLDQTLFIGSLPILYRQLIEAAPNLGIPIENGVLSDAVAQQIDDLEEFSGDDSAELVDDLRTAWLVVHEGARLALEHRVALSLIQ
jgi:hypothetical protein